MFEFSGSSAVSTVRTATTLIGEPLNTPRGVSVDINGALLIADTGNHAIRRYDPQTGMIATVAGTGRKAFSGDGGAADQATLDSPHWVAADGAGNLFVADTGNGRIRRVEPRKQEISTYAGAGPDTNIGDGDEAIKATLNFPSAVAFAPDGDLFIADSGHHLVRRVHGSKSNCISTVVGTGGRGSCDEGDSALLGSGNSGTLRFPGGLDIDDEGNLFIADSGNQIVRRYDPQGMLVETGVAESDIKLSFPQGIMFDSEQEELFITDTANHRVLLADSMLSLSLFAGTGQRGAGQASGPAQAVMLNGPLGVGIGPQGDVYIADSFNNRILKVDRRSGTTPTVSIAAGEGTSDLGDNGPAILAQLDFPTGLAFDRAGNLFIADALHHRIRRVDAQTGVISTFAGSDLGFKGDGGPASDAKLNFPSALRFGKDGSLFIADRNNHRVRAIKLSPPPPLSADDARVEMSVTTASDSVNPGEILDYNLAISNSTSEPISSLELTDMLPASVSLKSAIPSQGSCQSSPGRQVTCDLGTLRPEAEATVRIQVTVEDSAAGSIITNSASCHYQPSGSEPCQAAVSTRVGPTVGFALSFPEEVFFPSPIRYDIVVANHGAEPATGVTLRDTLPVGVTLLSSTTDTCTEDRGVLTCNLGDLAPRDEAEVSIEVSPQTANTTLTNLVEVFSDHTASITEVASTRVEPPREGLFLERTVPARKVNPGDSFGYTLTVTNAGLDQKTNVDVSVDVKLGDVMAGAARVQISGDIRFGCQESSSGLVCRLGTLSGEEKASIDITVRPLDAAAGHTLNSTASCRSDQTSNDQCRAEKVSTLVRPQDCADLAVTVDGPPVVFHSAQDREDIVYTLQVSNNGRSPGTGVRLTSVLPRDVAYKEYKQGGGGNEFFCSQSNRHQGTVTCTLEEGDLEADTSGKVQIIAEPKPQIVARVLNNEVNVGSGGECPGTLDDNSATHTVTTAPLEKLSGDPGPSGAPFLSLVKTADPQVAESERISYVLRLSNRGLAMATNVTVTDTLPSGVQVGDVSEPDIKPSGACVTQSRGNNTEVECSVKELGGLTTAIIAFSIATKDRFNAGDFVENQASCSWDGNLLPGCEAAAVTLIKPVEADLSMTKASRLSDDQLIYTLTVTNDGPSLATDLEVRDTLPVEVTFSSASPECNGENNAVTCQLGDLEHGSNKVVEIIVDVDPLATGDIINSASCSSAVADPNDCVATLSTNIDKADLSITKRLDPSSTEDVLVYLLEVNNSGPIGRRDGARNRHTPGGADADVLLWRLRRRCEWGDRLQPGDPGGRRSPPAQHHGQCRPGRDENSDQRSQGFLLHTRSQSR